MVSDLALARRLERAEAEGNREFVDGRARLQPDVGATWIDVAGAYAMFDGPDSPLTQTFGLGLFGAVTDQDLDRLESFFSSRGAATHHEVSPLAPIELLAKLAGRGYVPIEVTSVMYQTLPRSSPHHTHDGVRVRTIRAGEAQLWAHTAAEGWADQGQGLSGFMLGIASVNAARPAAVSFLAEADGRPIAAGALGLSDGVAVLAGASTIPSARGRGAQRALLHERLAYAAANGCDLAMIGAQPGGGSQRNAEREGFRIAYTRMKWRR